MYAMGKLPPLSPHFINGTKIRTTIQLALYPHFFNVPFLLSLNPKL